MPPRPPRISTVTTPSPLAGKRASSVSASRVGLSRSQITPDMVDDKATLAKIINDVQENAMGATEAARSNPFNAVQILQKQSLSTGLQVNLQHSLGIPWAYAYIVHAYPGSLPMFALVEALLPSGQSKNNMCSIIPFGTLTLTGTVTLAGGTATVSVPKVNTASTITFSVDTPSGTLGWYQATPGNGSFVVDSLTSTGAPNGADNSTLFWNALIPSAGKYDILIAGG